VPPLSTLESRGHWGIKKGLDNIDQLLKGLGRPEKQYPAILIAGTNGKGSTGAFLAYALKAAGLRVGWTTSPHLISPAERIWVDGQHIAEDCLAHLLTCVLDVEREYGLKATYFELMLAAALLAFKNSSVDIALVEVGMGGRWDSTNILDPILTILTNIGMDHTAHLGNTLEAIATEKLCTARDGRPLALGPELSPEWLAPLCECNPKMVVSTAPKAEIFLGHSLVNGHRINLAGAHQINNLATALTTIDSLSGMGWSLDPDCIYKGLSQAEWPCRFWAVPGLSNVVFDGAHNTNGAEALANHINRFQIRPHLFFSAMGDKDLTGMARALAATNPSSVALVQGEEGRYSTPQALQSAWQEAGYTRLPMHSLRDAAAKLKANSSDKYIVTGSLYFLGHLLRELNIGV
jgi:dihydrofolate synthase/folylpolyglutamate synthase